MNLSVTLFVCKDFDKIGISILSVVLNIYYYIIGVSSVFNFCANRALDDGYT